ncbi:Protein KTI12-like protein [Zea mays]|uniref:Protein KTI12 homolog n=1 Tax=Zea mays TaxID=4577 RepID=A0A1D6HRG3_MAIZE|nr:Protein KTI12-like protein [Zea mays]ONM51077.1 Protein KTI12-like protein [Zea mays]ONM51078.1 Protein KTI12-like protein [Zea mays]
MALVVMCGQPCSGKTAAAACLAVALHSSSPDLTVRIIDESSLHLRRNDSYKDMVVEKNLRGLLRSEVDRSVSRDSIIIVDSLNNIKGYRYELWCLARASGVRYCVLFCDTEVDHCKEWNSNRQEKGEPAYDTNIFEDLVSRFEKPDRRNRWDSPLFELFPSRDELVETAPVIAEAVSYLTKKVDSKTRDVKVLQPTIATQTVRTTEANSLYEMDKATQLGCLTDCHIKLERSVGLPELRSLRRTFIKLAGQYSLSGPPPPTDADSAKRMFVDYLNRELGA